MGIEADGATGIQFKFVMSSGEKSQVPWSGNNCQLIKIEPPGCAIAKIIVYSYPNCTNRGIKLFSKDGNCVLQQGDFYGNNANEILLQEGERILGVKSRTEAGCGY